MQGTAVTEPAQAIGHATLTLLDAGVLGAILVIALAAIFLLWRESKKERLDFIALIDRERDSAKSEREGLVNKLLELEQKRVHDARDLQQSRIIDAETVREKLIRVIDQDREVITKAAGAIDSTKDALVELRTTFRDLVDEVRSKRS
jgi:hypothetical protein